MTPRAGTEKYLLELLYYGAYEPNYKHFVIFIQPSSLINIHRPNTEQNAFESFHFISRNRLDIMELEAITACSKGQVVCHDGPGFKSPVLQFFAHNQSVWKCLSSTFQMMCKFSRVDDICTNGPRLHYQAIRDHQVIHPWPVRRHGSNYYCNFYPLEIDESESKGTTKYIYYFHTTIRKENLRWTLGGCTLRLIETNIGFPYMLSEGNSCMYGGLYIVQSISSRDSEILSLCTSTFDDRHISYFNNISVIIIHYSEYSSERILFYAKFTDHPYYDVYNGKLQI